eukprot:107743-Amphidinium_carterae.1
MDYADHEVPTGSSGQVACAKADDEHNYEAIVVRERRALVEVFLRWVKLSRTLGPQAHCGLGWCRARRNKRAVKDLGVTMAA